MSGTGSLVRTRSGKVVTIVFTGVMAAIVIYLGFFLWRNRTPMIPGMVYFPAGRLLAGPDKQPATLEAFYLDQTEVSNAQFAEFCRATVSCPPPAADPNLPVVNVTMAQAREYAKWRGKRLPTQLEWERAVRSSDGVRYPWGDAEDPVLANVRDNPTLVEHKVMPVQSYRPLPAYQLIGNVWEMVEGPAKPDDFTLEFFGHFLTPAPAASEPWIQIRGGSYNTTLDQGAAFRFKVIPERYGSPEIGFRCARNRE